MRQLKKCPEMDDACLEQPGPGSESLIRCLVRKAKRFDRLDVVKHLREITPAGTTGESVELSFFIFIELIYQTQKREFNGTSKHRRNSSRTTRSGAF